MKITAVGKSDRGLIRTKNQDAFGIFPELGLYIIADGMGGRPAGEVASQMTVTLLREFFANRMGAGTPSSTWLHDALRHVNQKVFEASMENPAYHGMGTTCVILWTQAHPRDHPLKELHIGFLGDSRAYRYRKGTLVQLTQDHSVVNEYIRMGVITPEAALTHPHRHVMSRGIGVTSTVVPEVLDETVFPGDIFLLCTDGLSNMLDHDAINTILTQTPDLSDAALALIEGAKQNGGRDNITIVLISFEEAA